MPTTTIEKLDKKISSVDARKSSLQSDKQSRLTAGRNEEEVHQNNWNTEVLHTIQLFPSAFVLAQVFTQITSLRMVDNIIFSLHNSFYIQIVGRQIIDAF